MPRIESDTQDGPAFSEIENEGSGEVEARAQARYFRGADRRHDGIGAAPPGTTKSGYKTRRYGETLSNGAGLQAQLPLNV